jgi:hypothetical protein
LELAANAWKDETFLKQNREAYFLYRLNGLKALGIDTFDIVIQLNYLFHQPYWWGFSIPNFNNNQAIFRKLYSEQLSTEELEEIWNIIHGYIVDEIERRMSYLQQDKKRNA